MEMVLREKMKQVRAHYRANGVEFTYGAAIKNGYSYKPFAGWSNRELAEAHCQYLKFIGRSCSVPVDVRVTTYSWIDESKAYNGAKRSMFNIAIRVKLTEQEISDKFSRHVAELCA